MNFNEIIENASEEEMREALKEINTIKTYDVPSFGRAIDVKSIDKVLKSIGE